MKTLQQIIQRVAENPAQPWALATLVRRRFYLSQKPGARLLVDSDGNTLGINFQRASSFSGRPEALVSPLPEWETPPVPTGAMGPTVGRGRGLAAAISSSVQGRAGLGLSTELALPASLVASAALLRRLVISHYSKLPPTASASEHYHQNRASIFPAAGCSGDSYCGR
jgi:hypothetical protein